MMGPGRTTKTASDELRDLLTGLQEEVRVLLSFMRVSELLRSTHTDEAPERYLEDFELFDQTVRGLRKRLDQLSREECRKLAGNVDLLQLKFHLHEEVRHLLDPGSDDGERLLRSIGLLHRHLPRLTHELIHGAPTLDPLDHDLVSSLCRYTDLVYQRRFEPYYPDRGGRPYLNKFSRDYRLTGIPDQLLLRLDNLARRDPYDRYVCVLKGGLTYAILLELLGVPPAKMRHVVCGRASGSQFDREIRFEPVDFQLPELAGHRVAVVEHNVATGATLRTATQGLALGSPRAIALVVDYFLHDVAGLTSRNLGDRLGVTFSEIHVLRPAAASAPGNAGEIKRSLNNRLAELLSGESDLDEQPQH